MPEAYVGLGSNIDAEENLRWAVAALGERFGKVTCSSVYRSPAYGFSGPDFLNMVVGLAAGADVESVEAVLSELENARGRHPERRRGSRTLDLDLLLFGQRVDAAQRLPRADVLQYPFVLAPLAEIAPGLVHPVDGRSMAAAWNERSAEVRDLTQIGSLDAA